MTFHIKKAKLQFSNFGAKIGNCLQCPLNSKIEQIYYCKNWEQSILLNNVTQICVDKCLAYRRKGPYCGAQEGFQVWSRGPNAIYLHLLYVNRIGAKILNTGNLSTLMPYIRCEYKNMVITDISVHYAPLIGYYWGNEVHTGVKSWINGIKILRIDNSSVVMSYICSKLNKNVSYRD